MSYENTKLAELVQAIKDAGSESPTSDIIYFLFGDEGYMNVMPFDNGTDYKQNRIDADALLAPFKYSRVEGDYGDEGEGESCYGVIRLGDDFFQAEWTYYSYNGCEYDYIEQTVREVVPEQAIITVYKNK